MSYYPNIKRPHHIQVWLDDFEYQRLNVMVAYTNKSREQVLRDLINGLTIKESPPADYGTIIRELRRIGANINQIAATLHSHGFLDEPTLADAAASIRKMEKQFAETFAQER